MTGAPRIRWSEDGRDREAHWCSARGAPPPTRVQVVAGEISADDAYGLACQGVALLWRGDFHDARQLLAAMGRRADRRSRRPARSRAPAGAAELSTAFDLERQRRGHLARTLGMLLIELDGDYRVAAARAPELRAACTAALGPCRGEPSVVALRELLGFVGAHQWYLKGIEVPEAGGRIHPHYGVFAPIRSEYIALVANAPLPAALATVDLALDIGTGTGVLAAVLARRGVGRVIATDQDPRAMACARDNLGRLGLASRVEVRHADLFPDCRAALVVCNPPWIPARPSSPLEHAVYDHGGRMLSGFLRGLPAHLVPGGEGWLVMSDLAEHLGLRRAGELQGAISAAGLRVLGCLEQRPSHPRAEDADDALHAARKAERTSLWRLAAAER